MAIPRLCISFTSLFTMFRTTEYTAYASLWSTIVGNPQDTVFAAKKSLWSGAYIWGSYGHPVNPNKVADIKKMIPFLPPQCRDSLVDHPVKKTY